MPAAEEEQSPENDADPHAANVALAELFVDAFYSYDPDELAPLLAEAGPSESFTMFYQGWADGARYSIIQRAPCEADGANNARCAITVDDDLASTLGYTTNATDTFELFILDGAIRRVATSSDDPPETQAVFEAVWDANPDLFEGPCVGFFDGGPTPQQCVKATIAAIIVHLANEEAVLFDGTSYSTAAIETAVDSEGNSGTFTATGSGICEAGTLETIRFDISDTLWWYEDEYTCADGSGSFLLRGELALDPNDDDEDEGAEPLRGSWTILKGTGDYETLMGGGTSTVSFEPNWVETYTGGTRNR